MTKGINLRDKGDPGANGTARAYARVIPDSVSSCASGCRFDHAKGVTAVTHPAAGMYCVDAPGIDPNLVAPAVSVDYQSSSAGFHGANAVVSPAVGALGCPANTFQIQAQIHGSVTVCQDSTCTTTTQAESGVPIDSDVVGFTIVIP